MSFFKKLWGGIKKVFGKASETAKANPVLVGAPIAAAVGLFLERQEHYADEIVKAIQGLRQAVRSGQISTNDVLQAEFRNMLARYGVKGPTLVALFTTFGTTITAVEQAAGLSRSDYADTWDAILGQAENVAAAYL